MMDLVINFAVAAPGYAILIAVLAVRYVHGRVSRRA